MSDDTSVSKPRRLVDICREIRKTWVKKDGTPNVNYAAEPYLVAMESIAMSGNDHGRYYFDTAYDMVLYFLSNATHWRGEDAARIKAELKQKYGIK